MLLLAALLPCMTSQAHNSRLMRIRVIQRPSAASVDGFELHRFEPGCLYDVGTSLGSLMLSEGWAEPVATEIPAPPVSIAEPSHQANDQADERPTNVRERSTPPADVLDVAADFKRRQRR